LLIQADAKMDEAGPRFIAQAISLFDEAVAKRQQAAGASALRIIVDQPEALTSIRDLLGESGGRGASVTLCARLEGAERADIQLPGKYTISPTVLGKIRVIQGVVSAEEEAA